ncbi:MAG: tetratricopeptide repeat protein [Bacteroidia bacterium]
MKSFSNRLRFPVAFALCIMLAMSCSTKKNTFVSRNFHQLNAHYNGFFNARERVKEASKRLATTQKDQYERTLSIFKIGDEAQAKSVYPDMDEAIKKSSIVITRHSMYIKGKEYNSWIDDNYLLIGKAQFYKHDFWAASETFQYVASEYKDSPLRFEAMIWLTQVYMQLGKYVDAEYVIDYLKNEPKFPKEYRGLFYAVAADYYLKKKDDPNAIEMLEKALTAKLKRIDRIRYTFILAQLYQKTGDSEKAFRAYERVIKMNPPYEMAFNAKINRARNFDASSESAANVKKQLNKMVKDEKNKEYLDQVYYALAGVADKENNEPSEIMYLNKSVRASVANNDQKALSYLNLGEICFSKKDYMSAAAYYDSTMQNLSKDFPDYKDIADKKQSLTRLVENLKVILREDSLQRVSSMTPEEREKFVDDIIKKENDEKERIKREELARKESANEEEELKGQALNDESQNRNKTLNQNAPGGSWYFYNQSTVSFGFNEFIKKWGERKYEDNWRRKTKESTSGLDQTEEQDSGPDMKEYNDSIAKLDDAKRKAVYLKNVSLSDTAITSSNVKIVEAYYNVGIIYREQLKEYRLSNETFETLLHRFPDNKYKLPSYYNLYRTYLTLKDQEKSDYYKNILLNDYPESEFAKMILNPNYWRETQKKTEILEVFYENTYKAYLNQQYASVIERKSTADELYPKNKLMPKFDYLKALAIGKTKPVSDFEVSLRNIVNSYPNDSVAAAAQNILNYINKSGAPPPPPAPEKTAPAVDSGFVYKADTLHFFLFIFENKGINAEQLKTKFSDYNIKFYSTKGLTISNAFMTPEKQYIMVKNFSNAQEAVSYYDGVIDNEDVMDGLDETKIQSFVITPANFAKLYVKKDIPSYMTFFEEKYQE